MYIKEESRVRVFGYEQSVITSDTIGEKSRPLHMI